MELHNFPPFFKEKADDNVAKKKVKITVYDQPWTSTRQVSKAEWVE